MTDLNSTQPLTKFKILLIGDDCIDVYKYGTVDRISPEAPVPVFKLQTEETRPGMVRNVSNNLKALGCEVKIYKGKASTKVRLIDIRSQQHIVRIDDDQSSTPLQFDSILLGDISWADAIVISDYGKGYVDYKLIEDLLKSTKKPIFVDTKKTDLARLEGCYVKINNIEYSSLKTTCSELIVTLGRLGAEYQGTIFPVPDVAVSDVTGAGDTFLSALTYKFLETQSMKLAIEFANRAASITVQINGVYAPTLEECR